MIESGQEIHFVDVNSDRIPCLLLVKLTDCTYRMAFAYNGAADLFATSLEISNSGGDMPLVYGEAFRYGKPLLEAFNDERYPLSVICPLCLAGDGIDTITCGNLGTKARLHLFDRPGDES